MAGRLFSFPALLIKIFSSTCRIPSYTLPTARRPRKLSYPRLNGWKRRCFADFSLEEAAGTCLSIASKRGVRSFESSSNFNFAMPARPFAYTTGKFACSSEAPNSKNNSKTCSSVRCGSAACLSILFMTTIGFNPSSKDFFKTNLVCGIGPSCASTTNKTESIARNTLSTSDPKSACPGVSTIFIFVPR